ncbi:hypothetical protein D6774_02880 [Candidatus Woesearchaeota archaeon]|nr:MAG: hypothetical protein D6774_02880 [Candidatus Woesearchaeota archaeon]
MNIKIRTTTKHLQARQEFKTSVKEIMIHEDLLNPKNETIAIGFAQGESSGIIEFTVAEFEKLYNEVKDKMHLIKSFKKFETGGALLFK